MKELETYYQTFNGKSPATIRSYKKDIDKLVSYFGIDTIERLKEIDVSDYLEFYNSLSLSDNSKNALIRNLSAFFNFLKFDLQEIDSNNAFFRVRFGRAKYKKVKRGKKVVLTSQEETSLINATGDNIQDRFMLSLMLTTGLRRDMVSRIRVSDIDGYIINVQNKGGDIRKTFMNDSVYKLYQEYMSSTHDGREYLFFATRGAKSERLSGNSINERVKFYARKADIDPAKVEKITAHRLRGTLITNVIAEKGIHAGMAVAFHTNINTTKIYDSTGDSVVENIIRGK